MSYNKGLQNQWRRSTLLKGKVLSDKSELLTSVKSKWRALLRFGSIFCITVGLEMLVMAAGVPKDKTRQPATKINNFWPTYTCRGCHDQIVKQHLESSHEMSFTNPVFQAQYRKDLLPKAATDPQLDADARGCIACHEPVTYAMNGPKSVSLLEIDPKMNGVTCDICHSMTGYSGDRPQNGNYIVEPSDRKLGPFKGPGDWHHIYSELQTKSEICAVCHEAVNRHGLRIKATFTEWQESTFAQQGVHCQDCHMNVDGFLTAGKPRFASGKAAAMTLGSAPQRERLYTHQFPGAHSRTQIEGALTLGIEAAPPNDAQNHQLSINVTVDNSRTGHSMPSGSADLRLLWIEVMVRIGDEPVGQPAVIAEPEARDSSNAYSIAGRGRFDSILLGPEVPKGSRIYRAVFTDNTGKPTLDSYNAVAKLFDNRLKAAEQRKESYQFMIPEGAKGDITIKATLKYLPYSSTFTSRFGLPSPEAVIVAQQEIRLATPDR
jgi:hypothetical protein